MGHFDSYLQALAVNELNYLPYFFFVAPSLLSCDPERYLASFSTLWLMNPFPLLLDCRVFEDYALTVPKGYYNSNELRTVAIDATDYDSIRVLIATLFKALMCYLVETETYLDKDQFFQQAYYGDIIRNFARGVLGMPIDNDLGMYMGEL